MDFKNIIFNWWTEMFIIYHNFSTTDHAVSVLGYTFSTNEILGSHPVFCNTEKTNQWANKLCDYKETGEGSNVAQVKLPDRHVLVDVIDISEHNFPRKHREGEGACKGSNAFHVTVLSVDITFLLYTVIWLYFPKTWVNLS